MGEFSRAQRVRLWLSELLFRWSCRVEPFYDEGMSDVNEYEVGHRFEVHGPDARFDFLYPRIGERVTSIAVGLEDVRAANDIRIQFDFDRDGWVIVSPTKFMWFDGEDLRDERLEEVAFIPAYSDAGHAELERMNGG